MRSLGLGLVLGALLFLPAGAQEPAEEALARVTPASRSPRLYLTSTSSALFAGHLANVLSKGVGAALAPTQMAAKLRAGFRGSDGHAAIIPEDELDARITQVLSH